MKHVPRKKERGYHPCIMHVRVQQFPSYSPVPPSTAVSIIYVLLYLYTYIGSPYVILSPLLTLPTAVATPLPLGSLKKTENSLPLL